MNLDYIVRSVAGRLSLREPQAQSLRKLAAAPEGIPGLRDHQARSPGELTAMVEALHAMFPKLSDLPDLVLIHERSRRGKSRDTISIWRRCCGWSANGPNARHSTVVSRRRKCYGATSESVDR